MKVFIVEDNGLTRFTIKTAVEKIKHEVMGEADSFSDAVEKLKTLKPDILLLDVILPDHSGLEVLKSFRKMNTEAKVIMTTALEQEALDRDLMASGANCILRKPFSVYELEQAINSVCK